MTKFAVWTLGADRPGIVAAVTGALFEQGCNLSDCSMTILAGNFAMVLVVEGPNGGTDAGDGAGASDGDGALDAAALEEALAAPGAAFDLGIAVRVIGADHHTPSAHPYVVSVYGTDRPGIVHHVATALAELDVNICDLETRVIGPAQAPVYAMLLEVELPTAVDPDDVADRLRELAAELGVDATLHPSDADVL